MRGLATGDEAASARRSCPGKRGERRDCPTVASSSADGARHHRSVEQRVPDARWRVGEVLDDLPDAVGRAHEVDGVRGQPARRVPRGRASRSPPAGSGRSSGAGRRARRRHARVVARRRGRGATPPAPPSARPRPTTTTGTSRCRSRPGSGRAATDGWRPSPPVRRPALAGRARGGRRPRRRAAGRPAPARPTSCPPSSNAVRRPASHVIDSSNAGPMSRAATDQVPTARNRWAMRWSSSAIACCTSSIASSSRAPSSAWASHAISVAVVWSRT